MPWGVVLTLALLAGAAAISLRFVPSGVKPAPWEVVGSAALTVAASFLVMRSLQSWLWGVLTAVLLVFLPLHRQWFDWDPAACWTESQTMIVLATAVAAWRLAFRRDFTWWQWVALAGLSCGALFAATQAEPPGSAPIDLVVLWLVPLLVLALNPSQRRAGNRPHRGNLCAFVLLGALLVLLMAMQTPAREEYRSLTIPPHALELIRGQRVLKVERLAQWAWPPAVAIPLMVWGIWSALRRGLRELSKHRAPLAWTLVIGVAVNGALIWSEWPSIAFVSVVVLLAVFGFAEVFRNIGERLVLLPPEQ
jgi:hypothetical protein